MFDWFKNFFKKKNRPEEVVIRFSLPDGKLLNIEAIKPPKYLPIEKKCKIHWDYNGISTPTNNCNLCWEYHNKKNK